MTNYSSAARARAAHLLAVLLLSVAPGCGASDATGALGDVNAVEETADALHEQDGRGAVYSLTNDAARNAVAAFRRAGDGTLSPAGLFPTGGRGTGAGLGSQGAIAMARGGRFLLAVDAGSGEVSAFRVEDHGLQRTDRVPSGGERPISLTTRGRLVYVLNAGGAGSITGLYLTGHGKLLAVPGSTRPLSGAGADPAQVSFSPDGDHLVVTEKATNRIDTYSVDALGRARGPRSQASAGQTPFGFAFDRRGRLFVSEAFGGMVDRSALSSYGLSNAGQLRTVSASVPTTETAACWVVVSGEGPYVYTTNTGSSSVTGYRIGGSGTVGLLDADGVTGETGPGSHPIDAALSPGDRFLYVLSGGTNDISTFAVRRDGGLTLLGHTGGLPAGAGGLAAR